MFEKQMNVKGRSLSWLIAGLIIINIFWGASGVAVKGAYAQLDTLDIERSGSSCQHL
ncbi:MULTISPECIES: hypothetical protein [Methanosarcina]|uniref:hypothetical protein n=1 Tax=Methanosarcina TaxID=2207 RepID=UPI000B0B9595|nr:hypothetical protein [Methanosarcina mazei]